MCALRFALFTLWVFCAKIINIIIYIIYLFSYVIYTYTYLFYEYHYQWIQLCVLRPTTGIFTCSEFSDSDNIIIIFYLMTTTVFTFMFACTCFSPCVSSIVLCTWCSCTPPNSGVLLIGGISLWGWVLASI